MPAVRSLLARVARLEQANLSPWLHLIGPFAEFEAEVQAGIAEGRYDPRDMAVVLVSVKRWMRQDASLHVL